MFSGLLFFALCGFFGAITLGLFLVFIVLAFVQASAEVINKRQTAVRVSEQVLPDVDQLVKSAAKRLHCPQPDCFVGQQGIANAYAFSSIEHGCIVLSSELIEMLTPDELAFAIGHEVGHIACGHTRIINVLSPSCGGLFTGLISPIVRLFFNVWSVKAEHTADRAGLLVARNVTAATFALAKVSLGPQAAAELMASDYFNDVSEGLSESLAEYLGTHPGLRNRIKQLIQFSNSEQYRAMTVGETLGEARHRGQVI